MINSQGCQADFAASDATRSQSVLTRERFTGPPKYVGSLVCWLNSKTSGFDFTYIGDPGSFWGVLGLRVMVARLRVFTELSNYRSPRTLRGNPKP